MVIDPRRGAEPHSDVPAGPVWSWGGADVLSALERGTVSCQELVRELLSRARRLEDLRSIITLDEEGALAAARRVDDGRANGNELPPLAGLPMVVKDNINVAGLPTTGGTPALRDFLPENTAPVCRRLMDAGAIVLGKTNMHELAFGVTTTNAAQFAGMCRNPYARNRVPGGSSGGTASAVAAGLAPVGLGTDTGASVRVPAAFTGTVALRPSVGDEQRYPVGGVLPLSATLDTVGPFARSVMDVALVDATMAGAENTLPTVDLRDLRLGVPAVLWSDLDESVAAVTSRAVQQLAAAGAEIVELDIPDLLAISEQIIFALALHEPLAEIPRFLVENGRPDITLAQIAARIASPDVRLTFEAVVTDAEGSRYNDAMTIHRPLLQRTVARWFADNRIDAMVFPTSPVLAPLIDDENGSGTISVNGGPAVDTFTTVIRNMIPGSCVGMPGLSLPAGVSREGLPVGLSVEGPRGSDRRLLAIGSAVERTLGRLPLQIF